MSSVVPMQTTLPESMNHGARKNKPKGGKTLTQRERTRSVVRSIVVLIITLICAVPLWYIVINTFKTVSDMTTNPLGLPRQWTLENYQNAFENVPIVRSFINTVIVTVFGVAFQVLIGAIAAYGMILRKSLFTSIIGMVLMIAFVIPAQSTLIPLYRMESKVGLVNTLIGLVIMYLGGAVFCYFLIVGYMRSLPFELIEAARIDGAGPFRIFWSIVLPLIRPILTTVIVFQTMGTWNDFMTANVFISSSNLRTIVLQVYNAVGQFTTDWPSFMTITVIALLPVFIFFIFCQKWIVSGLVAGSVKG
jgi:raffinose/stachyose/melibiose transport system permease protein